MEPRLVRIVAEARVQAVALGRLARAAKNATPNRAQMVPVRHRVAVMRSQTAPRRMLIVAEAVRILPDVPQEKFARQALTVLLRCVAMPTRMASAPA